MVRVANQEERDRFCLLQDARKIVSLGVGDEVAACWFNDPAFYIGKLEISNRELGLDLGNSWGNINEAFHVILLKKEKNIISIMVSPKNGDYMASIEGTNVCGCGKTPSCAIGKMILIHSELCGFEIKGLEIAQITRK